VRASLLVSLVLASYGIWAGSASASPASGPHETLESLFTTTQPNTPSGFSFTGRYHAAGDPAGDPPYMRRMTFYIPRGLRYDTSVPERCSASDLELATFGAGACPAGSRLGGGTSTSKFLGRFPSTLIVDVFNNTNEQIILARSPGLSTVARGRITSRAVEWASPTCFPSVQPAGCPVDDALQVDSSISVAPYTKTSQGVVRSYLTTPPSCPAAGHWETPIRLWWADGSVDTVVTEQPCTRP
jgi:hypothetical protein